jgi:uncharacterized protein with LGFP repeats
MRIARQGYTWRLLMVSMASVLAIVLASNVGFFGLGVTNVRAASGPKLLPAGTALSCPASSTLSCYSANDSTPVTPHGGPVLLNPKVFLIFEGNWAAIDMQMVNQYFIDVSGSDFEGILSQYYDTDSNGTRHYISNTIAVTGSVMDPNFRHSDSCGKNTIVDDSPLGDIAEEIGLEAGGIDGSTIYFVFTPPHYSVYGYASCSSPPACGGYHAYYPVNDLIYAVIPYGGGEGTSLCPTNSTDPVQIDINLASHEQFEAITDPDVGSGWNAPGAKGEIGDKCEDGHLGIEPTSHSYPFAQGEFSNASGYCEYPAMPYHVYDESGGGSFYTLWEQMKGGFGPLGEPIDNWRSIPGGEVQDFTGGGIYWSSATGSAEVQGIIYTEYANAPFYGATGVLGFPTTNELGIAGGRVSYFYGNLCGGRGPNNSGNAIYWSSTTGAHSVGGCIYNYYWHDLGGPGGNANFNLGFPTSDVQTIPGGYVSYFYNNLCGARGPNNSGSAIYDSSRGTYMVGGCIYNHYWHDLGGPGGNANFNLGYPVSDVQVIPGGYVSYFAGQFCGSGGPSGSGSAIYYSTSADEVQGCIYHEYVGVMNGPGGPLGFPVTDEQGIAGGRVSYFSGQSCSGGGPNGSGSAIYFPYAHEVQGCIYHEYVSVLGGPSNPNGLGFPIWDETGVASGRASYFYGQRCGGGGPAFGGVVSGSAIFWTSGTGAHEVQGCIYDKYWHMPPGINGQNQDGPGGALGFPLADEGGITSGCTLLSARSSAFQHGAIYFYNGTAYEVQGSIYTAYKDNGGAGGVMGLPVTDEYTYDSAGDRESEFENGYILFNKATGHITVFKFPPC